MPKVYLPRDAAAIAVGADDVVKALVTAARQRGVALEIVRTGSRGLFWLEPMLEVEAPGGRIAYGPVSAQDAPTLLDAILAGGGVRALITDRVAPGVVYTTFHHPDTQANVITTDYSDWATNCLEYKVTAVQCRPSNGPSEWQENYREHAEQSRRINHVADAAE